MRIYRNVLRVCEKNGVNYILSELAVNNASLTNVRVEMAV